MLELTVCLLVVSVLITYIVRHIRNKSYNPLEKFEPISDDEALLLTIVSDELQVDLLTYARTMVMSGALQVFLSDKKDALESVSYYMLLQTVKKEQDKKDKWEQDRVAPAAPRNHNEKMILQRLKRF